MLPHIFMVFLILECGEISKFGIRAIFQGRIYCRQSPKVRITTWLSNIDMAFIRRKFI